MKYEYLLFNLIVVLGPIAASFDKRVHFANKWRHAFPAITLAAIPYIVWDALVTGRHWVFNAATISGFSPFGLPIEEIFFFFTVPFASLFMWEVISSYIPKQEVSSKGMVGVFRGLLLAGIILYSQGDKEYTAFALGALGIVGILDDILPVKLFPQKRTFLYVLAVSVCNGVFNGYLTSRPVVVYDNTYNLGIRLGTIPVEDFFYGLSLILLATIFYELLKKKYEHSGE